MNSPNPDSLPTPADPTGPCPWCSRVSNFEVKPAQPLTKIHDSYAGTYTDLKVSVLYCSGCTKGTAVVTGRDRNGRMWWPAPGAGTLDKQVNAGVASTYDEGMKCLSMGAYRASAVMFRSALHLFVKDKGSAAAKGERHLKTALKHMKNDGDLHRSLWAWAEHLNQLGNEGAHPEDYDEITQEEAEGLSKFVRHLIRHEYEMPAQLLRDQGILQDSASEVPVPEGQSIVV